MFKNYENFLNETEEFQDSQLVKIVPSRGTVEGIVSNSGSQSLTTGSGYADLIFMVKFQIVRKKQRSKKYTVKATEESVKRAEKENVSHWWLDTFFLNEFSVDPKFLKALGEEEKYLSDERASSDYRDLQIATKSLS
jgi:hypothetical protein